MKYSVNENFLDEINEISSFFIGLMASDGNIKNREKGTCRGYTLSLYQSGDNGLDLIKQVYDWMSYDGKIYHNKTTRKISHGISISSQKLVGKLLEHNITSNKSSTYQYNGMALIKPFLQGYIEGDGCVGIYNSGTGDYYYISFFGNKHFKDSIIKLLPVEPLCREVNNGYFEIKFLGRKGIEFSNWLWETPVYENSLKYKKYLLFKNGRYKETKYFYYTNLNSKIMEMLKDGIPPKNIAMNLEIKRQTVYNLTRSKKNGRNTY